MGVMDYGTARSSAEETIIRKINELNFNLQHNSKLLEIIIDRMDKDGEKVKAQDISVA
jgi:hypothetical protein